MSRRDGTRRVPVDGGELAFEILDGVTEPILCVHGISSQRRLWNWLRAEAPDLTLIAPDLRGRADSAEVAGPSSVGRHSDDMIALLDHIGIEAVHVCGMSMGGFVAIDLAHRYPTRAKSLILVDGGFPMNVPPGLTPEQIPVLFADRLARLEQKWESAADYAAFFTANTAPLLDPADPLLLDYLEHDLRDGVVQLSGRALVDDAGSVFFAETPWATIAHPIRFLYAEWGGGPDTPAGYPSDRVGEYLARTVSSRFLPGTDHAASIMTRSSAVEVAAMIRDALDA